MRTIGRPGVLSALAVFALALLGAGPSGGERIVAAAGPAVAPPPSPVASPCGDNSAVLVAAGTGGAIVFRCEGGAPAPRLGPWSASGCDEIAWQGGITLLAAPADGWAPGACLVVAAPDGQPAGSAGTGRLAR